VNGGEEALQFCVEQRAKKGNRKHLEDIAQDVREKCAEERDFIESRQVEDLQEYFDRWIATPGVWK
jgi:hypothetical protein